MTKEKDKANNIFLIILTIPYREDIFSKDSYEIRVSNSAMMLVGVLDPSQRNTTTQMAFIEFDDFFCETYNNIIQEMTKLRERYYKKDGYLAHPSKFNEHEKEEIFSKIEEIGQLVYQLIAADTNPFTDWFAAMTRKYRKKSGQSISSENVTIITNDFNIPWYWMKTLKKGLFLNEICALGMLQLDDPDESLYGINRRILFKTKMSAPIPDKTEDSFRALIIRGDSSLCFIDNELKSIENTIKNQKTDHEEILKFEVERANTSDMIHQINKKYDESEIIRRFRIVHFSGHYSNEELMADEERIPLSSLYHHIKDSILILDGCNSSEGVNARADLKGLSSRLINGGEALGSVITLLPIKQDPIAGEILWRTFYQDLKKPNFSIGQALLNARMELKKFYKSIGSKNPAWLVYQLIGRPCIKLSE